VLRDLYVNSGRNTKPPRHESARRRLFLTADAHRVLTNPNSAVGLLEGRGPIEAAMTKWVQGERVYGRYRNGILRCGFMCRLDPPPPEIWEIRVTEPLVRWRLFGRFAEPDTLLLTSLRTRTLLGRRGSTNWTSAMRDCDQAWHGLFPNHAPFSAMRAGDYITENCDDFAL
jgi:hypothetical protein